MSGGRRSLGWVAAGMAAAVAHSAVAMVLLRPAAPTEAPAPALVIELAPPEPPAPPPGFAVPPSDLPPLEPLTEVPPNPAPVPQEAVAEPVLPDLTPLEPPTPEQFLLDISAPTPPGQLPVADASGAPILLSSARPAPRPGRPQRTTREEPRERTREAARRDGTEARPAPERQAAAVPRAEARSSQSAARDSGVGRAAAPQAVQNWESKVRQAVARHMGRTRISAPEALSATLALRVDGRGRVAGVSLAGGSGDARVDGALSGQARRLPRLPAPPDGRPRDLVVPFRITR